MGEESEKRFEALMNKLFHTPIKSNRNSKASEPDFQISKGKKRRISSVGVELTGNVLEESELTSVLSQAPSCRPWDRNDLFRRLSTFKSMTWFAKPKVVSPSECARRGWVNVDTDTISCGSCGSRLLFSTPSAWTQQQVEKAAMVFSLKLESGHKLLCPWINNSCAEEVAQFPIVSRAGLVEDYKRRFFDLSQLIALPYISPLAIDNMRTPELEQFLREFPGSGYHMPENSNMELPGEVPESVSSISYYQAQKLISLSGWAPRTLPYIVDFRDLQNKSIKDANVRVTNGQKQKNNVNSPCTNEGTNASGELQLEPSSVVLDCNICGANVGLWAFCTVSRPAEYLRFVGLTEVHEKNFSAHDDISTHEGSSGNKTHNGSMDVVTKPVTNASTSLGFTIAGGPPPAMLNYGASISLPVIGQSLRARLQLENEFKDHSAVQSLSHNKEDQEVLPESVNVAAEGTLATTGPDFIARDPLEVPQTVEGSISNRTSNEAVRKGNSADHHKFDVGEFSSSIPEDNTTSRSGGLIVPREKIIEADNCEQGSGQSNCKDSSCIFTQNKPVPFQFLYISKDQPLSSFSKSMEFDPIKHHRHFCPWIVSTGKFAPGWKETLSALEEHEEFSFSSPRNVPSSSLIEVDDPVSSVKYLFTSPNKKTKIVHGS
ncbi:hypothetical protein ACJIZ3_018054 [Penstemon smallii]|uniref:C3HC-type domain-containing protein n=1 Tax=Penstemon smallii TaxID=265156 RepID=A0ABD3SYM3_9LAMI